MFKNNITQFRSFHEYFEFLANELGDSPCLTDGERPDVVFSYAQLNEKVNQTAQFLFSIGIAKGDRFVTLMDNCTEFFLLYLASMKMGTLIMPLIADLPLIEIVGIIERYEAKVLISDLERYPMALEVYQSTGKVLKRILSVKDLISIVSNFSSNNINLDNVRMEDPGSLYFSSGTTGEPKGIPQSPKNLLTAAYALAEAYSFSKNDTQMGILPIYHTALATYGFWPSICVGSNFVLFEKFSKSNFWGNIEKHQVAFVEVVPTILAMLLNPPEDISKYNLTNLKFIGSGSAPLTVELHNRFEDTFGIPVANKYGLSETAPIHFNPPKRDLRKDGSIGRPLPMCEAKIFDEENKELGTREIGEIVIRGDSVISSYYKNPQADKRAFSNGWFHTGDLGYVDNDGFFFLVDRKKDVIIRGGAKIYPNEVDNVLLSHPNISEGVSFGIPDKIYGEEIVACIILKNGSQTSEDDIVKYCRKYLPEYKCPRRVYFVNSISHTASGKILRRELAERYEPKR